MFEIIFTKVKTYIKIVLCNESNRTRSGLENSSLNIPLSCALLFWSDFMKIEYMELAYNEALTAFNENEVPVGAIIVKNDEIIAVGHNLKEKSNCCVYHAEILAIIEASKLLKNWRLDNCDMYVTLEPCPMCASAIKQARINNLYCGLANSDKNNEKIIKNIFEADKVNPKVNFYTNLYIEKVSDLMQKFFSDKRKK